MEERGERREYTDENGEWKTLAQLPALINDFFSGN